MRLNRIVEAEDEAVGRADVLPPMDSLVEICRHRLRAFEADLAIGRNAWLYARKLPMNERRESEYKLICTVEPMRVGSSWKYGG